MTLLAWLPATSPWVLAGALLVSLGAGVVRGFAGFGYAALTVAGLSLFVVPSSVVPAVLGLEVVGSFSLWRRALPQVDHGWLRALLLGNLVFIPVGIAILALVPPTELRLLVAGTLFTAAVALRVAGSLSLPASAPIMAITGVASGLMNGVAASGGVAAALLMTAARVPALALRATIICFLLLAGAYTRLCAAVVPLWLGVDGQAGMGLLSRATVGWMLLLAPTMLAGIWLGGHSFARSNPGGYRQQVLLLLIVISGLGVLRAVLGLMAA